MQTLRRRVHERRLDRNFKADLYASDIVRAKGLPSLSPEEKKEIDDFWAPYGIKFKDYSYHQMFYGLTGKKDPRFIPDNIMYRVIYPYYNDTKRMSVFSDKNLFSRLMPMVSFPKEFGCRSARHYYDENHNCLGDELSEKIVDTYMASLQKAGATELVIKKAVDSNQGTGVKKIEVKSKADLYQALLETPWADFALQEVVKQHPFFAQFNESSVNIIRINTWRHQDQVSVFNPCVRFGIKDAFTDVSFVDGVEIAQCVGIDEKGCVTDEAFRVDGTRLTIDIKDRQIPHWGEILETVKKNHFYIDREDYIAWDMIVDDQENIRCIEFNVFRPGSVMYQMADGPVAADETEDFLAFLRSPEEQKKRLPKSIRRK